MDAVPKATSSPRTFSGDEGLAIREPLIFEQGDVRGCGVDLPDPPEAADRLGDLRRADPPNLPGLSEPETMRHYVRLSRMNYAIDMGIFPLGSCTMKHNPRLNEKAARLSGFADLHPLQPVETVQGMLEAIDSLGEWLRELSGMPAIAMSPRAGAQGELCGMMAIRAALRADGESRSVVLAPASAHGTNPATAAALGFGVETIPVGDDGTISAAEIRSRLSSDVAAIMLTNPNTCGLFEREIRDIADSVREVGGYFYCDGANFNALAGRVRPGDLGIDAMHINLHKTFSTPHGGGGPGAGPVAFSERLARFAPLPRIERGDDGVYSLIEHGESESIGRMSAFHGQAGTFIRALAYMMSHGIDGIRQATEDAVLNANLRSRRARGFLQLSLRRTDVHA